MDLLAIIIVKNIQGNSAVYIRQRRNNIKIDDASFVRPTESICDVSATSGLDVSPTNVRNDVSET
jgi:hypothetical protein